MINKKEKRLANRERQRRYRERHKGVTAEAVTHRVTPGKLSVVTDKDIDNLPLSIKSFIMAVTRSRHTMKLPDNLRERQEAAVRNFRGF